MEDQDIYERQLFNGVRHSVGGDQLVYSDRGSARAERQTGGGGPVYPRIDYSLPENWQFYRSEDACSYPTRQGMRDERQLDPEELGDHTDRLYRAAWGLCGGIATLPPDLRDVLIAIDVVGLSYREAAQSLCLDRVPGWRRGAEYLQ